MRESGRQVAPSRPVAASSTTIVPNVCRRTLDHAINVPFKKDALVPFLISVVRRTTGSQLRVSVTMIMALDRHRYNLEFICEETLESYSPVGLFAVDERSPSQNARVSASRIPLTRYGYFANRRSFMALQSQLLRGDPQLEACATSDPAHIVPGAAGEHVRKIQIALNSVDNAFLNPNGLYDATTAAAVLGCKRNIINRTIRLRLMISSDALPYWSSTRRCGARKISMATYAL
jgi:hypothetical protein